MKTILAILAAFHFAQSIEGGGGLVVSPNPVPIHSTPSYTGPGDVVSGAMYWVGLRAYTAAIAAAATQKLTNLSRASDSHTCDFLVATSGGTGVSANCSNSGDNGSSLSSWCNATTCSVTEMYDQSGTTSCSSTTCNFLQATAANQPSITVSCLGGKPCLVFNGSTDLLQTANTIGSVAQPISWSIVNECTTAQCLGTGAPVILGQNARGFVANSGFAAGKISCSDTTAIQVTVGTVWRAIQCAAPSNSGVVNVDGTETSGSIGTAGTTSPQAWGGISANVATMDSTEGGAWNLGFSGANRTALCQNQQAYYGSGNFGAVC